MLSVAACKFLHWDSGEESCRSRKEKCFVVHDGRVLVSRFSVFFNSASVSDPNVFGRRVVFLCCLLSNYLIYIIVIRNAIVVHQKLNLC